VDVQQWSRAFAARRSLLELITALPPGQRSQVANLAAFGVLFPGDPEVAGIRLAAQAAARNRLLIVEDEDIGDTLVDILEQEGYECDLIRSWRAWKTLKETGLSGYDGAFVDLHLLGREDAMGLHIVEHLRDYTDIPCAVVTTNPMHTRSYERQKVMAQYRLVDLVDKREGWLRELPATARLLVGTDDESRRHRLTTWVRAAEYRVRRETEEDGNGSVARARLAECLKAVQRAENAIKSSPISEAQRLSDSVCKQFAPLLG
jgi:CheY-like chemotaxis protein